MAPPLPKLAKNVKPMKTLMNAVMLVLGSAWTILAANGQETPISLETAKEQGRAKSRFLKETKEAARAPDVLPKANVALFQESVGPILNVINNAANDVTNGFSSTTISLCNGFNYLNAIQNLSPGFGTTAAPGTSSYRNATSGCV